MRLPALFFSVHGGVMERRGKSEGPGARGSVPCRRQGIAGQGFAGATIRWEGIHGQGRRWRGSGREAIDAAEPPERPGTGAKGAGPKGTTRRTTTGTAARKQAGPGGDPTSGRGGAGGGRPAGRGSAAFRGRSDGSGRPERGERSERAGRPVRGGTIGTSRRRVPAPDAPEFRETGSAPAGRPGARAGAAAGRAGQEGCADPVEVRGTPTTRPSRVRRAGGGRARCRSATRSCATAAPAANGGSTRWPRRPRRSHEGRERDAIRILRPVRNAMPGAPSVRELMGLVPVPGRPVQGRHRAARDGTQRSRARSTSTPC